MSSAEREQDLIVDLMGHFCVYGDEDQSDFDAIKLWWDLIDNDDNFVEEVATVMITRVPSEFKRGNRKYCPPGYNMFIAMDCTSGDLTVVALELGLGSNEEKSWAATFGLKASDLYYVDSVYVKPEWRGMGIGANILHRIKPMISRHFQVNSPLIVLLPSPVEIDRDDPNYEKMKERLRNWYLRNGFIYADEGSETLVYER